MPDEEKVATDRPARDERAVIVGLGYLGTRVARIWTEAGLVVHASTRRWERFGEIRAMGLEPFLWDVVHPPETTLPIADVVLYAVGFDRGQDLSMRDVYVDGLARTLERCPPPRRFLYASSTGVYGDAGGDWLDESSRAEPTDESGRICLEAEQALARMAAERGIPHVVLRLAGLYGPGRGMIGLDRLKRGEPVAGDPEGWLNLIHIDDAARAVEAARTRARPGATYIVADGNPVRRRDFYGELARLARTSPPVFRGEPTRRARGDRRLSSARMRKELLGELLFPSFEVGLASVLS